MIKNFNEITPMHNFSKPAFDAEFIDSQKIFDAFDAVNYIWITVCNGN